MPSLTVSLIPVGALLATIVGVIIFRGAETAQAISHYILLGAAVVTASVVVVVTGSAGFIGTTVVCSGSVREV